MERISLNGHKALFSTAALIDRYEFFTNGFDQTTLKFREHVLFPFNLSDRLIHDRQRVLPFGWMIHHLLSIGRIIGTASCTIRNREVSMFAGWIVDPEFGGSLLSDSYEIILFRFKFLQSI